MKWKGFSDVQGTIFIDLSKSLEELWKKVDKDGKWGVNKAVKENLIVDFPLNVEEENKFYELYEKRMCRSKLIPKKHEELKKEISKLFLCKKEGHIIAGAAIKIKGDRTILFLNASQQEFLKYQPNNLLYWKIIEWSKNNKFSIFDLGGYQLNAKEGSKLYDINKFKLRWGGEIKTYPVFSKNPFYIIGRKAIRNFVFMRWVWDRIKRRPKLKQDKNKENKQIYETKKSVGHFTSTTDLFDIEKQLIEKYFKGKVLDLGCGCGRTTKHLYDKGYEVIGIDPVENMIKKARERFAEINFQVGDACKLNFEANYFDIVFFSYNGLDYIFPERNRIKAIKEISRVLNSGGYFIYSSHNPKALFFRFRPNFFLRNLVKGTFFSKYKHEKQSFGNLHVYYGSLKNQKQLIEKNTSLSFIKKVSKGIRDLHPHYLFMKK